MTAFNVVRFRAKPDHEAAFVESQRRPPMMAGMRRASLIKTGERAYCFIGEWDSFDSIVAARPAMIAFLDSFREHLEDMGGADGVTDPVSGAAVIDVTIP